jgi:hypothetical protein
MSGRLFELPTRIGWRDHVIGAVMGITYVGWLLAGARALGFPRDEGIYFHAGQSYFAWWRHLWDAGLAAVDRNTITRVFEENHEHPALMKTLFGASEYIFHEKWPVFADASTALRFPAMCMAGIALWVTYLFGARAFGRRAGLMAGFLLGLMPRVFFHAHLACFDVPVVTFWVVCTYAHWRAVERRTVGWFLAVGLLYGLALETKHNAWFFPAVVVPHALFVWGKAFETPSPRAGWRNVPWGLVSMAVLGPAVLVALWPYLWFDTRARVEWWVGFHLHHEYYNIEFLGKNYFGPPSPPMYLPVMVAATVPTVTLFLFFIGAIDRVRTGWARMVGAVRRKRRQPADDAPPGDPLETDLLFFLAIGVAMGPFFLPATPIFGGTKHWITAYPFLAIVAGRGFDMVARQMDRALARWAFHWRAAAEAALAASVIAAPLAVTAHSHPFGLSAYVPLVGGTAGGADLGLNRQFWGFTTQTAAEEFLNPHAAPNASVFILDTTWEAWRRMQEEGRVRRDLRAVGAPSDAEYALVQHELHMNEVDYDIWASTQNVAPAYVVTHDDVPIVSIYQHPR